MRNDAEKELNEICKRMSDRAWLRDIEKTSETIAEREKGKMQIKQLLVMSLQKGVGEGWNSWTWGKKDKNFVSKSFKTQQSVQDYLYYDISQKKKRKREEKSVSKCSTDTISRWWSGNFTSCWQTITCSSLPTAAISTETFSSFSSHLKATISAGTTSSTVTSSSTATRSSISKYNRRVLFSSCTPLPKEKPQKQQKNLKANKKICTGNKDWL